MGILERRIFMSSKSSENYLDNLLDSIYDTGKSDHSSGSRSKRYKSDNDAFLREFEEELESDAYKDYFADFEMELEAEEKHDLELKMNDNAMSKDVDALSKDIEKNSRDVEPIPSMPDPSTESAREVLDAVEQHESLHQELGELDTLEEDTGGLYKHGALRQEADGPVQEIKSMDELDELEQMVDDLSNLDDLSGLDDLEEIGETSGSAEPELQMTDAGEPDLAGLGDDDLMEMLSKADELSDIGDILNEEESGDLSEAEGSIEDFAQAEMKKGDKKASAKEAPEGGKKKGGFLAKLKLILFGADEEEEESGKTSGAESAGNLSDENRQILQELEGEEKAAKKKAKKEKKPAKPKKEKPKKAPKPKKPPKPKKEKKPKEKDNTPPLPKGPVILIVLMAISIVVLVILGTTLLGYQSGVQQATSLYNKGNYTEAFAQLQGLEIKDKDLETYEKAQILASVDSQYQSFLVFHSNGDELSSLDKLVCAAGRYNLNLEDAASYGCLTELESLGNQISDALSEKYQMTMDEAIEIYNQRTRTEYSVLLHRKLSELGLE
jgi:hypothetical protein